MYMIKAGADDSLWHKHELPLCPSVLDSVKDKNLKVSARAEVGAQRGGCYKRKDCLKGNGNYFPRFVHIYGSTYLDSVRAQGGYSTGIIAHEQYVFAIRDEISNEEAASMFFAGLTVFAPMRRRGVEPGKKVGVIGIGGLGHYAILFAKAMGAYVVAYSYCDSKKADVLKMDADDLITEIWIVSFQREMRPIASS